MTASSRLNIVVLTPMPRASEITAIIVKPGFFTNVCKPYRTSCQKLFISGSFLRRPQACFFLRQARQRRAYPGRVTLEIGAVKLLLHAPTLVFRTNRFRGFDK